jgi:DNA-binding protein Fis
MFNSISEDDLMLMMEKYIVKKLGSNNDYEAFLHLYEVPLLRAGIKRFKSQSQLANKLGINRNTLRKKLAKHAVYQLKIKES